MLQRQWRNLLVWARFPQFYQRAIVWWEFHSDLRAQLKAFRLFLMHRGIAMRNAAFGSAMIVATRQVQSRAELRDMSGEQIMRAWRAGRLQYLTSAKLGIVSYGDRTFHEWVNNGGQLHPFRPSERR
jgi:hypothetical protein